MSALGTKLRKAEGDRISFWCPGCNEAHAIVVSAGHWTWDGNVENPTFAPSVLVASGHYAEPGTGHCWCTYPEQPPPFKCYRCHSFVKAGMIEFLGDCTHELAGKTVTMVSWGGRA